MCRRHHLLDHENSEHTRGKGEQNVFDDLGSAANTLITPRRTQKVGIVKAAEKSNCVGRGTPAPRKWEIAANPSGRSAGTWPNANSNLKASADHYAVTEQIDRDAKEDDPGARPRISAAGPGAQPSDYPIHADKKAPPAR